MSKEGEDFERLVEGCHKISEPEDISVTWDDHIEGQYSKTDRQIDVSLKYKVNPSDTRAIVECRDRSKFQDVTWIDSLIGKCGDVGTSQAIAVTTSGFTKGAVTYANDVGIDLRIVSDVSSEEFTWNKCEAIRSLVKNIIIKKMHLEPVKKHQVINTATLSFYSQVFKYKADNKRISMNDIWNTLPLDEIYSGMQPGDPRKILTFDISFQDGECLQYYMNRRAVDLKGMIFMGEIWVEEKKYPLRGTRVYKDYLSDKSYVDIAEYDFERDGKPCIMRIFRRDIPETNMNKFSIGIFEKPGTRKGNILKK
jgi:hypothetical protein